jgi:hypothetical protein
LNGEDGPQGMLLLIVMEKGRLKGIDEGKDRVWDGLLFADDLINIPEDVELSTRSSQRLASGR